MAYMNPFNVSNEICFHEDTLIKTDKGLVKIKDLKSNQSYFSFS